MTTKNLIQEYADIFAELEKKAAQNLQHAKQELQQMQEERQQTEADLKYIKDTMKEKHRGFYGVAKAIIKMTFKHPQTPAEIEQALSPVIEYREALSEVPYAEQECSFAEQAESAAETELFLAQEAFTAIENLKYLGDMELG